MVGFAIFDLHLGSRPSIAYCHVRALGRLGALGGLGLSDLKAVFVKQ
jgi:hypothetical protein